MAHSQRNIDGNRFGDHTIIHQGDIHNHSLQTNSCLIDLRVTDPRDDKTRIQNNKGGLLKESYRWILDHPDFKIWLESSQYRLLWIKGDPGKGKTMLLCGIIDEIEELGRYRVVYFFCQATEASLRNATAVLRGLMYSLILQYPSLISYVEERYKSTGKQLFEDKNAWTALSKIFMSMINDRHLENVILVVDALDECIEGLLNLLKLIAEASSSSSVKWIVSSRNWVEIEEALGNTGSKSTIPLELNERSISAAVQAYIQHKVQQLSQTKGYDKILQDSVQDYLLSNAGNTFLWVALVCEELGGDKIRKRNTLKILKSFPPGLDALYRRMMDYIYQSPDADLCAAILAVSSVVNRPITLPELKCLMESLQDDGEDDILDLITLCGSFLTYQNKAIFFVHQSAKDFLIEQQRDKIFPSGTISVHREIVSQSIGALAKTLRRDMYDLHDPGMPIENIEVPNPNPLAAITYSCVYWIDHLCYLITTQEEEALYDVKTIYKFLNEKYIYWLEAMSLLKHMPKAVTAIRTLLNSLKSRKDADLLFLLQDAHRFILSHNAIIEMAPLQTYVSALLFSPTKSLVRQSFKQEEPNWVTLKPSVETHWNACLQEFEGHSDDISSIAFSPDGRWLASGGWDNIINIWDVDSGGSYQRFTGHRDRVQSVAFSPDGQWLASGSNDDTVKLWDITTGNCIHVLRGHESAIFSVAFSANGLWLASGSSDGTIRLWDIITGDRLRILKGHGAFVSTVAFSANNQSIVSGSGDKTIKIWDLATGSCLQTLNGHKGYTFVSISPDGKLLASGSTDGSIKIWDAATGKCTYTLEEKGSLGREVVVFSPDSQRFASTLGSTVIKIWDTATGSSLQTIETHGRVTTLDFSPDGQSIASDANSKLSKIWDLTPTSDVSENTGEQDSITSLAFSANGHKLTSISWYKHVMIWDTEISGKFLALDNGTKQTNAVVLSPDGQRLASALHDSPIRIWDILSGCCLQTLQAHGRRVEAMMFSADDRMVAVDSGDMVVRIWDIATGNCLQALEGHSHWVNSMAFSPNGQLLASGSHDETIRIWDIDTGNCLQTLKGHDHMIDSVAFSSDSQRLVSGSSDHSVRVWDITTGNTLLRLSNRNSPDLVAYSPNGQWVASCSDDGMISKIIRIWDIATGHQLLSIRIAFQVTQLSFDPTASNRLYTSVGVLQLDCLPSVKRLYTSCPGYSIHHEGTWVLKDGRRILWLPPDYRPRCSAVKGSTVAVGCASGKTLIIGFSESGPDLRSLNKNSNQPG